MHRKPSIWLLHSWEPVDNWRWETVHNSSPQWGWTYNSQIVCVIFYFHHIRDKYYFVLRVPCRLFFFFISKVQLRCPKGKQRTWGHQTWQEIPQMYSGKHRSLLEPQSPSAECFSSADILQKYISSELIRGHSVIFKFNIKLSRNLLYLAWAAEKAADLLYRRSQTGVLCSQSSLWWSQLKFRNVLRQLYLLTAPGVRVGLFQI